MLKFKGSQNFRQRVVCATLSQRPIRIDDIRASDQSPGVADYEANLLRLLEKITTGCIIEINETGTTLRYKPGIIVGGSELVHDCGTSRGIGYFIEPLILLGFFAKRPIDVTLKGVTNHPMDPSVDVFRSVTLPLLKKLGVEDGLDLKIISRGAAPQGGGEVRLRVPVLKELPPINFLDEGMVRRVRGIAHSMRVPPQNTNRMVDGARGVLNDFLADVYVFTDHMSGKQAGNSPGFGVTLVAETTAGCLLSAEVVADPSKGAVVPEDLGKEAAALLLEEVQRGGVVDSTHQALLILMCAAGTEELQQIRLGPLTPYAIRTLRHVLDFFGVRFSIRPETESKTLFLTCIGAGLKNLVRKAQ